MSKISKIQKSAPRHLPTAASDQDVVTVTVARRILVFSRQDSLPALVKSAAGEPWETVWLRDALEGQANLMQPNVRIVILDDATIAENDRGWFLNKVRRDLPFASIIYVASLHSEATERTARASGAHYYTAGPVDNAHFTHVLSGFLRVSG